MTTVLIPAAGFGKKIGSPKAKELLYYGKEDKPIIEWGLDLVQKAQMQSVVIVRKDKKVLLDYLKIIKSKYQIKICEIEGSREWPHSLLQSQVYWSQKNIVLLPDTRFSPKNILLQIDQALNVSSMCFATFDSESLQDWGCITNKAGLLQICEKPQKSEPDARPWGVFGFQKERGQELLEKILLSCHDQKFYHVEGSSDFILMDNFCDITRTKVNLRESPNIGE